ncbi:hypothetical protein LTS17_001912 [Exophiala oligosperma]
MTSKVSPLQRLQIDLPWTQIPLISNAPMSGFASSDLAVAVTQSAGLGFIGFPGSPRRLESELEQVKRSLQITNVTLVNPEILPVGVGIIIVGGRADIWSRTISKYQPAVVWLSFGSATEFDEWTTVIREASPSTKVWIQLGSVCTALEVAQVCRPDALVLQGVDAGGHGHEHGASLLTLIPEVADTLLAYGLGDLPLVAAGGIMDGRSAAAAISLGASGLTMGTRFLGAMETIIDPDVRREIFDARDGGLSTRRSRLWDDIWGPNPWPQMYDGRCLRNAIYDDVQGGLSMDQARRRLYDRDQLTASRSVKVKDVSTIWAGTGVGMVKRLESAADIVEQIQTDTRKRLRDLSRWG